LKTFLISSLTLLSLQAFALDLGQKHQALCARAEVKAEMGEKGSCRVVMAIAKAESPDVVCSGKFKSVMPCLVSFKNAEQGSTIQIVCGFDAQNPALDQTVPVDPSKYTVSAVVTKQDQSHFVMNDKAVYTIIKSNVMSLVLASEDSKMSGSITLNLKTGPSDLTDVSCQ
jgi:hypothetical protein